jgi:hypothetical protein
VKLVFVLSFVLKVRTNTQTCRESYRALHPMRHPSKSGRIHKHIRETNAGMTVQNRNSASGRFIHKKEMKQRANQINTLYKVGAPPEAGPMLSHWFCCVILKGCTATVFLSAARIVQYSFANACCLVTPFGLISL